MHKRQAPRAAQKTKPRSKSGSKLRSNKRSLAATRKSQHAKNQAGFTPSQKPLGILGGGQLARMLALQAHSIGVPVAIYSESRHDPAAQVSGNWHQGSLDDGKALKHFISSCSLVTFESEFLDAELLEALSQETGVAVSPRPKDMAFLQDRATQKSLLLQYGLPTSDYVSVTTAAEAREAFSKLDQQVVFKKRRFGYDGYGTFVVRSSSELNAFLPELARNPHGFIAERFVKFTRELAVIAARSANGEVSLLPFVETKQENSRCFWVKGPIAPTARLKALGRKIKVMLNSINYVGVIGIELFESKSGLLVNELAPRVHNSGHYSLEALESDQFTLHVRSVLGMSLGQAKLRARGFAMLNLLGSSNETPTWQLRPGVHLHWYGKAHNRTGRKMGHLTALAPTPALALNAVLKQRQDFNV